MSNSTFALCRYDRGLDREFGSNGLVLTDFLKRQSEDATKVAVDSRNRIIAAGTAQLGNSTAISVARYTNTGKLDRRRGTINIYDPLNEDNLITGFGGNGRILFGFKGLSDSVLVDLLVDKNNRILLVGHGREGEEGQIFAISRRLPNGDPDPDFGDGGHISTDFRRRPDEEVLAATIDKEGRIIVVGRARRMNDNGGTRGYQAAVSRYNEDGTPDNSFHGNGRALYDFEGEERMNKTFLEDVYTDSDNRIIVAGRIAGNNWSIARIKANGHRDSSFGDNGTAHLPSLAGANLRGARAKCLLVQPDDKIIVAGSASNINDRSNKFWVLARYDIDGNLDTDFGNNGWVHYDAPGGKWETPDKIILDSAGRIIFAGKAERDDQYRTIIGRLFPNGSRDRSFDNGGNGFLAAPGKLNTERRKNTDITVDNRDRVTVVGSFEPEVGDGTRRSLSGFYPSLHGWHFENQVIPRSLVNVGPHADVFINMTYCGGMALSAMDHYLYHESIPDITEAPEVGSSIANYIFDRQLNTLGKENLVEPLRGFNMFRGPWGKEFKKRWFKKADKEDSQEIIKNTPYVDLADNDNNPNLYYQDPEDDSHNSYSVSSFLYDNLSDSNKNLYRRTNREIKTILNWLSAGQLVLIGMVYDDADKLWDNHQVLAYHFERKGNRDTDQINIYIYDPNFPDCDDVKLTIDLTTISYSVSIPGSRIRRLVVPNLIRKNWPVGNHREQKLIRGFFQMQRGDGNLPDIHAKEPTTNFYITVSTDNPD